MRITLSNLELDIRVHSYKPLIIINPEVGKLSNLRYSWLSVTKYSYYYIAGLGIYNSRPISSTYHIMYDMVLCNR